jgi:hypothetical protein
MSLIPSAAFSRFRAAYGAAGEITQNDPTPDSRLGTCSHLVEWTFAAVFSLVATSAFAQEQAKPQARSVSPDGKWEFRAGAAGEQGDFVIAKAGSVETSLVLSEDEYVDGLAEALGRAPGYANIVWAPDSKSFALNHNLHFRLVDFLCSQKFARCIHISFLSWIGHLWFSR